MKETVPVFGICLTQVNTGDIYYETLLHNSLSISSSINHTIRISPVLHINFTTEYFCRRRQYTRIVKARKKKQICFLFRAF